MIRTSSAVALQLPMTARFKESEPVYGPCRPQLASNEQQDTEGGSEPDCRSIYQQRCGW